MSVQQKRKEPINTNKEELLNPLVSKKKMNKKKIFNDPVYGFISIPCELVFDLIEHPYFQRLRRIQQLGLSSYVYPGAVHSRFHHALGAMHLMTQAIDTLRAKGIEITEAEAEAASVAILLHDIGHGPFSHTLEHTILKDVHHETVSTLFMEALNKEFKGQLSLAIDIFEDRYEKRFLHQLVSSQLDLDRMDYLTRDSFFTGVHEGVIGYDRIIKMLNVRDDKIVVEEKGIYSIEKFIISRRLMYWQVYLHKTVLCAEMMLIKVLERARIVCEKGDDLFLTPTLQFFMENNWTEADFHKDPEVLQKYALLDDSDIMVSMKTWQSHPDFILSDLSKRIVERKLFKTELQKEAFSFDYINQLRKKLKKKFKLKEEDVDNFLITGATSNSAYSPKEEGINILFKNGEITDIAFASDQLNIGILSAPVVKYYLCYPK